ncbi:MAG: DUF350 domain-containing protein [Acidobacteria bacterium]|nr:DUF350 domain-containing protein [Acidobacteriota bacterium]
MNFQVDHFINAVVYSLLGVVTYFITFFITDKILPADLWGEIINKQNTALAILVGFMALGIGIIIAAAVH